MTHQTIMDAQMYLTIQRGDQLKTIVNIESLRRRHSDEEIIKFLKEYLREKEKALRNMILIDKTHRKVDEIVAAMFRLTMAIKTLEDGDSIYLNHNRREVKKIVRFKQGTEKSSKFHRGNRSSHSSTRVGENKNHDGEDRDTGDETRGIA
ncbi:MAG: hypothetical protein ACLQBC_10795 [Syntrophales bacterium]